MHNRPHPPRTPVSGENRYRNNDKHSPTSYRHTHDELKKTLNML